MIFNLLVFLMIGLVAGWLAGLISKRKKSAGFLGNLIIGTIGAFLGGFLFRVVGFTAYGLVADIVMATVGALILLFLLRFIK
ncbi:MAG: GlsB/YeaQ/YmgE family stress response membrane protein [Verrucomicrobiae bacterium]|nr:GlsB/YeaQ/YmgE family stress response membrane protein [Verrucomicrobiae bacterium]